LFIAISRSQL